jgi:hypothetical protein
MCSRASACGQVPSKLIPDNHDAVLLEFSVVPKHNGWFALDDFIFLSDERTRGKTIYNDDTFLFLVNGLNMPLTFRNKKISPRNFLIVNDSNYDDVTNAKGAVSWGVSMVWA